MPAPATLTSKRLRLTPMVLSDAPALFTILGDPIAMRFWQRPALTRLAVAEDMVAEQIAAMQTGICRYWTVREAGDAVGSVDLSLIADKAAQLGFLFRRDCWGRGLASETVGAVVGACGLERLSAQIDAANLPAGRVLEKNGFKLEEKSIMILADGRSRDCAFYAWRR